MRPQADYCPYYTHYSDGACHEPANQPSSTGQRNFRAESYGQGGVCLESSLSQVSVRVRVRVRVKVRVGVRVRVRVRA